MRTLLLATVLACIGLSACSDSSGNGGSTSAGSIIPLAINNKWVLDSTLFDVSGASHAGGTDSIKITSSTISPKDGSTYFDLKYFWLMGTNVGVYIAAPPNFYNAYRYFKYPANAGETFRDHTDYKTMPFPIASKPDSIATLVSDYAVVTNSTPITVKAGTFNCYEYRADWKEVRGGAILQRDIYYLAPNTGFVRTEHYSIEGAGSTLYLRSRVDLRSFTGH
jgi:hypothetical protein